MMLRRNPLHSRLLLAMGWLCLLSLGVGGCQRDPYRNVPDDQLMQRATTELGTFNFQMSADMFTSMLSRMKKDDPRRPEAMFGLAMSLQNIMPATQANIDQSQQRFKQLIEEYPDGSFTPMATLLLGRLAEVADYISDPVDLDAARKYYQQVIDRWPGQEIADEAALRTAETYVQQYDNAESVKQGVEYLVKWLKDRPDNVLAAVMWQYVAETFDDSLHDPARALDAFIAADKIGFVNQAVVGRTWWHMADLARQLGRLDVEIAYHQKIIREAPKSGRAWESQQALEKIRKDHPELHIEIPPLRSFIGEAMRGPAAEPKETP